MSRSFLYFYTGINRFNHVCLSPFFFFQKSNQESINWDRGVLEFLSENADSWSLHTVSTYSWSKRCFSISVKLQYDRSPLYILELVKFSTQRHTFDQVSKKNEKFHFHIFFFQKGFYGLFFYCTNSIRIQNNRAKIILKIWL